MIRAANRPAIAATCNAVKDITPLSSSHCLYSQSSGGWARLVSAHPAYPDLQLILAARGLAGRRRATKISDHINDRLSKKEYLTSSYGEITKSHIDNMLDVA